MIAKEHFGRCLRWAENDLLEELRRPLAETEKSGERDSIGYGSTLEANKLCNLYRSLDSVDFVEQLQQGQRVRADGVPKQVFDDASFGDRLRVAVSDGPKQGAVDVEDVEVKLKCPAAPGGWACGPHARSNWLPIGAKEKLQLCVGGWPFRLPGGYGMTGESEEEAEVKVKRILQAGVTTFVNLTSSNEFLLSSAPECSYSYWAPRAIEIAEEIYGGSMQQSSFGKTLKFDICCEMPDEGVTSDDKLATLLEMLLDELRSDQRVLYVHCYGGHGRTGVACCSLLCVLYPSIEHLPEEFQEEWACTPIRNCLYPANSLSRLQESFSSSTVSLAVSAIALFNRFHAVRELEHGGGSIRFPHSYEQLEQVARVAARCEPFERIHGLLWESSD